MPAARRLGSVNVAMKCNGTVNRRLQRRNIGHLRRPDSTKGGDMFGRSPREGSIPVSGGGGYTDEYTDGYTNDTCRVSPADFLVLSWLLGRAGLEPV